MSTAPAASGGVPTVLTIAGGAECLTESATTDPLFVINNSDQLVWAAANSSVGPSNGVPIEPRTAVPWTTPGQVWAVLDPDATGPATVTITSAIADWTPSPAAIAAEVAAQLLATGVPNVITTAVVAQNVAIGPHAQTTFPIAGYAEIIMVAGIGTTLVQLEQLDAAGNLTDLEIFEPQVSSPARIAVSGVTLKLIELAGTGANIASIIGTNRPAVKRYDTSVNAAAGDYWQCPATLLVAAQTLTLNRDDGLTQLAGGAWAAFVLAPSTVKARFELIYTTVAGDTRTVLLLDTTEMVTSSSGLLIADKLISLPAVAYSIAVQNTAGASETVTAQVALIPFAY